MDLIVKGISVDLATSRSWKLRKFLADSRTASLGASFPIYPMCL